MPRRYVAIPSFLIERYVDDLLYPLSRASRAPHPEPATYVLAEDAVGDVAIWPAPFNNQSQPVAYRYELDRIHLVLWPVVVAALIKEAPTTAEDAYDLLSEDAPGGDQ